MIPDKEEECSDETHNPVEIRLGDDRGRANTNANANANRTGLV